MIDCKFRLIQILREQLELRRCYCVADATTRPTYPEYQDARSRNIRRIKQCIKDIRWVRRMCP